MASGSLPTAVHQKQGAEHERQNGEHRLRPDEGKGGKRGGQDGEEEVAGV